MGQTLLTPSSPSSICSEGSFPFVASLLKKDNLPVSESDERLKVKLCCIDGVPLSSFFIVGKTSISYCCLYMPSESTNKWRSPAFTVYQDDASFQFTSSSSQLPARGATSTLT